MRGPEPVEWQSEDLALSNRLRDCLVEGADGPAISANGLREHRTLHRLDEEQLSLECTYFRRDGSWSETVRSFREDNADMVFHVRLVPAQADPVRAMFVNIHSVPDGPRFSRRGSRIADCAMSSAVAPACRGSLQPGPGQPVEAIRGTSAAAQHGGRVSSGRCARSARWDAGSRVYVTDGKVVHVEGDKGSPVSRGRLCPRGSSTLSLVTSPSRETKAKYRRPHGTEWEDLDLDKALDMIADRVIETRARTWEDADEDGHKLNRTLGFCSLGGATLDTRRTI